MLPDWGGDDRMIILIFVFYSFTHTRGPQSGGVFRHNKGQFYEKRERHFDVCVWIVAIEGQTTNWEEGGGLKRKRKCRTHRLCVIQGRPTPFFFLCVKYISLLFSFDNVCLFVCEIWLPFLFIIILRTRETCDRLNGWMHIWYGGVALISFFIFLGGRERRQKTSGWGRLPFKTKKIRVCVCVVCIREPSNGRDGWTTKSTSHFERRRGMAPTTTFLEVLGTNEHVSYVWEASGVGRWPR